MPENSDDKTRKYLDLGHSEAENHARTQQKLYEEHVARTSSVTRIISEFFKTNLIGFGYHYFRSRFGRRHPYQFYPVEGDSGVYQLNSSVPSRKTITIGLLSDWGTDTTESDGMGHLMARHAPDYTLHLGDIYFVGSPKEVAENFTAPHASWYYGASGSLALAGNHEMYSSGSAYFQQLLPAMYIKEGEVKKSQRAGFFCLENEHWRIIGLDTAYTSVGRPFLEVISPPDCHLRKEQLDWLRDVVRLNDPSDRRGLVFLSHHPYISAFRDDYFKPGSQLCDVLDKAARPVIWFWGHDHRLVGYHMGQNKSELQAYGRCIGHGGMPVETKMPSDPDEVNKMSFYDRRIRTQMGRHSVGYNGLVLLELDGPTLKARYRDQEDTLVLEEEWGLNKANGQLEWKVTHAHSELTIFSEKAEPQ
ncbi:metallophosphoesterase family protein [Arundinibacter roseus]|uniref:Metallophosphoesterase n=1 Tax=Arundinibacter roseus TaxID=2070510 RepID=A0A4R4K6V6_9BACT|nr:metallophosphoesterase [Arundinibacter roseus]TDB62296.1 metallophosphoesterase [Arundinibacter roseus]